MTLKSYCYLGTPLSAMLGNYGRESIDIDKKNRGENHCFKERENLDNLKFRLVETGHKGDSFHEFLKNIRGRVACNRGLARKLTRFMGGDAHNETNVFNAIVLPAATYNSPIWSLSAGKDNQLEKEWILAARNVLSLESQAPHEVLLCELGWTKLSSKRRTADAMWWNKLRNMPQLKIEFQSDEVGYRIPYKLMLWLRDDTEHDVNIKEYSKNWVLEVEKWLKENGLMGEDTMKKKVMREKCREIEHVDSAKSLKKYLNEPNCLW